MLVFITPIEPAGHQYGLLRLIRMTPMNSQGAFVGKQNHSLYGFSKNSIGARRV